MKKRTQTLSSRLLNVLKAVLAVNTLLVLFLILLGVSIHRTGVTQLNELGAVTLQAFRAAKPMMWSNRGLDSPLMRNFVKDLADQKVVINFFVYTKDKEVIFEYVKPKEWQLVYPVPKDSALKNNNLVIYDIYEFDNWHGGGGGMHGMYNGRGGGRIENYELFMCLVLDASGISKATRLRTISILTALLMEAVLILLYLRTKQMINAYVSSQKKLAIAQQEATTGRFASILAHEIKNPLSSIKGLSTFSLKKISDPTVAENLERSIAEVDRLTDIVNGFLSFGKPIDLEIDNVSIKDLVDKAIQLLSHDITNSSKKVEVKGSDFTFKGDYNKLLQVLVNLILNAVHASPKDIPVTIYMDKEAKTLSISNNIEGDADIDIDKIFEPFYTTKTQGSGLGLAVSRKITDIHGYNMNIVSKSPFVIILDFKGRGDDTYS